MNFQLEQMDLNENNESVEMVEEMGTLNMSGGEEGAVENGNLEPLPILSDLDDALATEDDEMEATGPVFIESCFENQSHLDERIFIYDIPNELLGAFNHLTPKIFDDAYVHALDSFLKFNLGSDFQQPYSAVQRNQECVHICEVPARCCKIIWPLQQRMPPPKSYPMDVFIILSEYISPEDVGRFAGICIAANEVVKAPRFWRRMFERYIGNRYRKYPKFPKDLHVDIPVELGIRQYVIRSLFCYYRPLKKTVHSKMNIEALLGRTAVFMWKNRYEGFQVTYYIKFVDNSQLSPYEDERVASSVFENENAGAAILQIKCERSGKPIPKIIGQNLLDYEVDLGTIFPNSTIRLYFGKATDNNRCFADIEAEFKFVAGVRIFDWWNPFYPHPSVSAEFPEDVTVESTTSSTSP